MTDFDIIRSYFESGATELNIVYDTNASGPRLLPVEFENVPDSRALKAAKNSNRLWARLTIRDGAGVTQTMGRMARRRYAGVVFYSLFTKNKTGTTVIRDTASRLIDAILTRYKTGVDLPVGLHIRTPTIQVVGVTESLFQLNVSFPYQMDFTDD